MSILPEPDFTSEQYDFIRNFLTKMFEGKVCPHCDTPIESKEQIGCCVYARPCACRLYCGIVDATPETALVYGHS